jgi:hypothetical protein
VADGGRRRTLARGGACGGTAPAAAPAAAAAARTRLRSAGVRPQKKSKRRCLARASPGVSAGLDRAHRPSSTTSVSAGPRKSELRSRFDDEYDVAMAAGRTAAARRR